MATSKIEYLGNLKTRCTHLKSGIELITDPPVDNNGKGESFSPTDLLATSYVSCMLTIIGIYCDSEGIQFNHATAEVNKIMGSNPRRVSKLEISIDFSGNKWNEQTQKNIINAGENCPVALSVDKNMELKFNYKFK